jgi:large subunit ribosomal protein L23
MNPERKYDVILAPWITEKSTAGSENNQFTFRVARDSTKIEIKSGIEELFGVTVTKVNTINMRGKVKRFRGRLGKRAAYKKAIVTIAEGQSIDITTGI